MKIIVTGAAGFIGSHLAETFARNGEQGIGNDSFCDYYWPKLKRRNAANVEKAGAKIVEADLAADDLKEVLAGADIVYHLAAQPGIDASVTLETYVRNNLTA